MPLIPGARLGSYEVIAEIGRGGMGEVYQARDTKLDRDVALKVLPEAFTSDPDRLARFEREAKVLASLNHPSIGSIYGLEDAEGTKALVLELVEGPTLADRIKEGPIPIDEALPIAKQSAEALEAAHEQGIIHRDLKPANVKVKADGTVKVLDFGLAKPFQPGGSDPSDSPTITVSATASGVIMGTAAYMSPEQASGSIVDGRADVWSFGAVLFEMLTGRRAFAGESVAHVLAAVLKTEPDWTALPADTPPMLSRLLRRCLAKNLRERLRHIGDAGLEVTEARTTAASAPFSETATDPASGFDSAIAVGLLSRHKTMALAALTTVVLVVAGAVYWGTGPVVPAGGEAIDSVAVLPFENVGGDPDNAYLSDGIAESLINDLSTLPNLRVVPRAIAFARRGQTTNLQTIGQELNVRAVITGRVTQRGDTLVIGAELTDVVMVAQLWGERYTRPASDLIALHSEVTTAIARSLRSAAR